jgi:hypothetical protein
MELELGGEFRPERDKLSVTLLIAASGVTTLAGFWVAIRRRHERR